MVATVSKEEGTLMTATKMALSNEDTEESIALTEEYEILEPGCVLRIPDAQGNEQAVTLRPRESVSSVLERNNIRRAPPNGAHAE